MTCTQTSLCDRDDVHEQKDCHTPPPKYTLISIKDSIRELMNTGDQLMHPSTKIIAHLAKGEKIGAIKLLRQATHAGLKESKDTVEQLIDELKIARPTDPYLQSRYDSLRSSYDRLLGQHNDLQDEMEKLKNKPVKKYAAMADMVQKDYQIQDQQAHIHELETTVANLVDLMARLKTDALKTQESLAAQKFGFEECKKQRDELKQKIRDYNPVLAEDWGIEPVQAQSTSLADLLRNLEDKIR